MSDMRRVDVSVAVYDEDPGHVEITLQADEWREEWDLREWWLAMSDVAGVLGRVGVGLAPFVADSARIHNCVTLEFSHHDTLSSPPGLGGCHLVGDALLRPGHDVGSSPGLWLYVPTCEQRVWLDRIAEALTAIADDANALATVDRFQHHDQAAGGAVATDHDGLQGSARNYPATVPPCASSPDRPRAEQAS